MEIEKDDVVEKNKMTKQEQIEYEKYKYKVRKFIDGLFRGATDKKGILRYKETDEYKVHELLSYYADKGEQGRKLCELLIRLMDKYHTTVLFYHQGIQVEFPENIKEKIDLLVKKLEEIKQEEAKKEAEKDNEFLDQIIGK